MERLIDLLMNLNWLAVLVATIANFAIGALWYSVLFGKAWIKEMGWEGKEEEIKENTNMAMTLGGSFVLSMIIAISLALLPHTSSMIGGIKIALLLAIGVSIASMWKGYLFEKRSIKMVMINGGHEIATFVAMGAIIGAWH